MRVIRAVPMLSLQVRTDIKSKPNNYGFIAIHKTLEVKDGVKRCLDNIGDYGNLLTYEYYYKVNKNLALPLFNRYMQTTCEKYAIFDSYANDSEFMGLLYNKQITPHMLKMYTADTPKIITQQESMSECFKSCESESLQCKSNSQKQAKGTDGFLEALKAEEGAIACSKLKASCEKGCK